MPGFVTILRLAIKGRCFHLLTVQLSLTDLHSGKKKVLIHAPADRCPSPGGISEEDKDPLIHSLSLQPSTGFLFLTTTDSLSLIAGFSCLSWFSLFIAL